MHSKTLKTFFKYLKPYKKEFGIGLFALFIVDLLNSIPPLLLKRFVDEAETAIGSQGQHSFHIFFLIGLFFVGVALVQGYCRFLWREYLIKASYKAAEQVRIDYHQKLQKLPQDFYQKNPIGDLMSLATNDVEAVRFALGPGFLVFADALFILLTLPPFMLMLSPKLSIIALLPMVVLPFVIPQVEAAIRKRFEKVQEQFSKLTGFAQENIEGIQVVKSYVKESAQVERFDVLGREFVRLNSKLTKVQAIVEPLFATTIAFGFFFLLWIGGKSVSSSEIGLGTFIALTKYIDNMAWPMMALGMAITHYQRGRASLNRIQEILDEKEEGFNRGGIVHSTIFSAVAPLLEVKNLNFQYSSQGFSLKNVSFVIEEKSKTALIGKIGCGKSTLIQILSGSLPAPPNTVFYRGIDISKLPLEKLRDIVSISTQEPFLFAETLEWNVSVGFSDNLPHPEQVERALDLACFHDERKRLGLDYRLAQRAQNLSGGQKSRVAMARAFAKNAPLLILDDCLSNVDVDTEYKILNNIVSLNRTLVFSTHRLSMLEHFEQILVLENGEIAAQGKHHDLCEGNSIYRNFYDLQEKHEETKASSTAFVAVRS